jgi:hypothetical protein
MELSSSRKSFEKKEGFLYIANAINHFIKTMAERNIMNKTFVMNIITYESFFCLVFFVQKQLSLTR